MSGALGPTSALATFFFRGLAHPAKVEDIDIIREFCLVAGILFENRLACFNMRDKKCDA